MAGTGVGEVNQLRILGMLTTTTRGSALAVSQILVCSSSGTFGNKWKDLFDVESSSFSFLIRKLLLVAGCCRRERRSSLGKLAERASELEK